MFPYRKFTDFATLRLQAKIISRYMTLKARPGFGGNSGRSGGIKMKGRSSSL
jgi:hypothetical protein